MSTPNDPGLTPPPRPPQKSFFKRHGRKVVFGIIALGVGGLLLSSKLKPIPVVAAPIVRGTAIDAVYATGTVEADDRVQVKAKTSGSIAEIFVKEGDRVKKGDRIARIDNPSLSFELKRGKVDLGAASRQAGSSAPQLEALRAQAQAIQADLSMARQDLTRQEKLAAGGAVAQADLDRARARVAQLEATVSANEAQQRSLRIDLSANAARQAAQVQTLEARLSDTEVLAPLDGIVLAKQIELGEVVTVNQTLFKIGDTSRLILEVSVDEADIGRVSAATDGAAGAEPTPPQGEQPTSPAGSEVAVSLYAFPKTVFPGHVFEVLPDANRERRSFLVKVRLDKPPVGLRSGMSGEVNILVGRKTGVLLAPSEAESEGAVWLVDQGRVRRTNIHVGIRDLLRIEITDGLSEGQLVVIDGQDKIQDGSRVSVTRKEPDPMEPVPDNKGPVPMSPR